MLLMRSAVIVSSFFHESLAALAEQTVLNMSISPPCLLISFIAFMGRTKTYFTWFCSFTSGGNVHARTDCDVWSQSSFGWSYLLRRSASILAVCSGNTSYLYNIFFLRRPGLLNYSFNCYCRLGPSKSSCIADHVLSFAGLPDFNYGQRQDLH